jgi:RNA polymerase sigma-70 factor (ECF subfamily)
MVDLHMPELRQMTPNSSHGDPGQDFVTLFLAHQPRIYAFIISLMPNRSDADDVLQETGLTLYQKFPTFQPGTDFVAWACRIAQYKVLDFGKRRGRDRLKFSTEILELIADEHLQRGEQVKLQLAALDGCLAKLPSRDRELLGQCYRSKTTTKAVAEALGRPVDTIYKGLRRIRSLLHDCIQRALAQELRP